MHVLLKPAGNIQYIKLHANDTHPVQLHFTGIEIREIVLVPLYYRPSAASMKYYSPPPPPNLESLRCRVRALSSLSRTPPRLRFPPE